MADSAPAKVPTRGATNNKDPGGLSQKEGDPRQSGVHFLVKSDPV